jgi:hypothetical protein
MCWGQAAGLALSFVLKTPLAMVKSAFPMSLTSVVSSHSMPAGIWERAASIISREISKPT